MTEPKLDVAATLRRVAACQREQLLQAALLPQIRARVVNATPRRSRRLIWATAGVSLAAALGAAVLIVSATTGPRPLAFTAGGRASHAGDIIEAGSVPTSIRFSDGTSLELQRGSRMRVSAVDATGAEIALLQGSLDASVVHTQSAHWRFAAGRYQVAVTGTRFSMMWDASRAELSVAMQEGSVNVSEGGAGRRASLRAGQTLHASAQRFDVGQASELAAQTAAPALPEPPPEQAPPMATPTPAVAAAPAPSHVARASSGDSWRKLAAAARYPEALHAAEQTGFDSECRRLDRDGLLLLGDVARLARDAGRAEQAYVTARRRFPAADRPVYALGLVAFEQRRDFAGAASWFETYVRRFPTGPLAAEAAGRLIEARDRAGDRDGALRAARDYLERHPSGPHAALARRVAAP